ncbi:MAG: C_GCAxxG_C_C family protein [Clostridia bacterium]|nr:C_GCAxxG_C_C family protein [Clostridia bacterium]
MTHVEKARDLFLSGCSCSQAVLGAFALELGIDHDTAMKLASSFGGGLGGSRELCGAVSGMLMVAGLKWGYCDIGDNALKTEHYARTRELLEAFKAAHGTTVCHELLSELGKLSENPSERTPEYYKTRPCARFVETAAAILDARTQAEGRR